MAGGGGRKDGPDIGDTLLVCLRFATEFLQPSAGYQRHCREDSDAPLEAAPWRAHLLDDDIVGRDDGGSRTLC